MVILQLRWWPFHLKDAMVPSGPLPLLWATHRNPSETSRIVSLDGHLPSIFKHLPHSATGIAPTNRCVCCAARAEVARSGATRRGVQLPGVPLDGCCNVFVCARVAGLRRDGGDKGAQRPKVNGSLRIQFGARLPLLEGTCLRIWI